MYGRNAYTSEDDAAILNYVSTRRAETGGNQLWQEMEKQHVTSHTWQSMKFRYKKQLAKKQQGVLEVKTTGKDNVAAKEKTGVEGKQLIEVQKASGKADVAPPHTHPEESDSTQIDVQSIPTDVPLEDVDCETSISLEEEAQHINGQTDGQQGGRTHLKTVESETPHIELQMDIEPSSAESSEAERPQITISPQKQGFPENYPPAEPESSPKTTTSSKKLKDKQTASPVLAKPSRPITRSQFDLEAYGKKLRSHPGGANQPTSSTRSSKKTKSAVKSALVKDALADQPPSKRIRATSMAESQPETSGHNGSSNTERDDECHSVVQEAAKKKEKRQLGILEMATKEFEDESECNERESQELHNQAKTAATSAELLPSTSDAPADPAPAELNPERGPGFNEAVQETRASSEPCVPDAGLPDAGAAGPAAPEAGAAVSQAHLFIFDSESQEDDFKSVYGDGLAAPSDPQPTQKKDTALSLTQVQLEEDQQRLKELMNQTHQDVISVTKALLKTSGDFSAALNLLLNPSVSAPLWNRHDDGLLLSADPAVRKQLQEKYGEENLAKRIVFLEVEG
ncbi:telomeric repeat-binding factor 2-interacting protein 1 isoform X2 [Cololabis saira]|uniref:telomeric repeat-binding factor 2-interacting protein 1 isoform X2 n=1 Tax=Cololabis saira TaxID=129043 RepID=UPI002AD3F235|nr:telomeric repeat-binding factor 2-interacting protein 1 isoform X2 [Cololabis saira]